MCGISGFFLFTEPKDISNKLTSMSTAIRHRGPDDEGFVFANIDSGRSETYLSTRSPSSIAKRWPVLRDRGIPPHHVGLAQVRYSIIDLSEGGHQPMWSTCGQICLTFNGEIYNYLELKDELSRLGYQFHTKSDTEVLLTGYLAWGEFVFARINGFFAVALLDLRKNAVLLARDRLGKAQLYLTRDSNQSVFWASEIKALLAAGVVDRFRIDTYAVNDFLIYNRRDRTGTFWTQVEDFPPGHFAWLSRSNSFASHPYWKLPASRLDSGDISIIEAANGLRDLLADALLIRLRADVPIAFELSGGMDSSALVGLAAGLLGEKFTTYTVEFPQPHSNEEPFARAVAAHFSKQIDYRVIHHAHDHFWEEADRFVWLQEEPFHAPNLQTNQHLRSLLKHDGADVVITGAAGDEMLAGYPGDYTSPFLRHLLTHGKWNLFIQELKSNTELPPLRNLRRLVSETILSEERNTRIAKYRSGELELLSQVVPRNILLTPLRKSSIRNEKTFHGRTIANMTYRAMNYWLRSGGKSDYGIPIESRAPFLDYRVVEYCCRLPPEYLIHNGWYKHVLRMAVKDYLPEQVLWRRQKMGFPFPLREWLSASKHVVHRNLKDLNCPYVDTASLFLAYDNFLRIAPFTLWRLISLALWWRKVIEGRSIYPS